MWRTVYRALREEKGSEEEEEEEKEKEKEEEGEEEIVQDIYLCNCIKK